MTNVDFYDLTAIIKREWILAFCAELERRGLTITYQLPTGTRSEVLDAEVLAALHRTGCRNICYAPESGSPVTLARIKKKIRPERMLASLRAATGLGIVVKTNLMIGFPGETRGQLWETVRFGITLAWLGVEDIPLFPFIPYPATALYDELRAAGQVPPQSDEYFARLGYGDLDSAQSFSRHVTSRELGWVRIVGMLLFLLVGYVRFPRRIVRTIGALWTERSTSVVELRLVDMKRRGLAWLGRQLRRRAPMTAAPTAAVSRPPDAVMPTAVEPSVRRVA